VPEPITEWYEQEDGDESAEALVSRFEHVRAQNRARIELGEFYSGLYYDREYNGFSASSSELVTPELRGRQNDNVIQRVVTALAAKFARQKAKPTVLTDGADWALQQRAKKYDKYIWGVLHDAHVYELQRMSDLHMLLHGTGAIYCTTRRDKICCEVAPTTELFVSTASARYGSPLELYRKQCVDRRRLARLYKDSKTEIEMAQSVDITDTLEVSLDHRADMVEVVTGWRLPSFEGAGDGKLVVAIKNHVLDSSEWKRMRFPFAFSRYGLPPEGFWGWGVVAPLVGRQLELNRTSVSEQEALRLLSAPFIAVESGSKIVKSHLSNEIGRIIEYTGTPPNVITPGAINPELFEHSDRIKSSMFAQFGVSEMAAQGYKPAGLESAPALRAYSDMMDDSIHDVLLRREQQILDLAEVILDEAEELGDSSSVTYVGPFGTEKISFADAHMDRDSFVLKIQPTSALSTTLAGKLEDLADMRDLGIISDPAEMSELLQLTDLDTSASRRNSMRDLLLETLESKILGDGVAVVADPAWDLKLALKLCIATKLRAQLRGAPKDRIDLLRTFETQCIDYLRQAAAPPAVEQQPTGEPTGEPLPPPMDPTAPMTLPGDVQIPEVSPIPGGQPGVV
jgi:hypothetical protein